MSPRAEKQRPLQTTRGKKQGVAGRGRDARWGSEHHQSQPRCKQRAEQRRMRQPGRSHPPGAERQERPGDEATWAARRAREHRARPCSDRLGGRARGTASSRRGRDRAAERRPGRRRGSGAEREHGRRASPARSLPGSPARPARSPQPQRVEARRRRADIPRPAGPRPAPACGPQPLATVGGGAGRGRTEISLSFSLSPRGKGEWRRDRLRELQLPCGLRNSRGVCRGDAIMASVLAREAAALRRRCEHLPTACAPPSAQAPWARGSREGPVGQGAEPALGASCARFHRRTTTNMRSCPPVLRELTHWALTLPSHVHITC